MKFGPPREPEDELFHMTAMVDVVFILLAFFIVAAQFQSPQRDVMLGDEKLAPPTGAAAEDLPNSIPVRLFSGRNGAVHIMVGQNSLPDNGFGGITAVLARINMPEMPVVIASDLDLPIEQTAMAIDAVLASPMKKFSLSRLAETGTDAGE